MARFPVATSLVALVCSLAGPQAVLAPPGQDGIVSAGAPLGTLRDLEPVAGPALRTTLSDGATVAVGDELSFAVVATLPGKTLAVALRTPQPGLTFRAVGGAPSPAQASARWRVPITWTGVRTLVFEAWDIEHPAQRSELAVTVHVRGAVDRFTPARPAALQLGDVTGDGVEDVVALARNADVDGVANAGAIYVWSQAPLPDATPRATLVAPEAGDGLGSTSVWLVDVTGDGVLDVVSCSPFADRDQDQNVGAVFVWAGGATLSGSPPPTATLWGEAAFDYLGNYTGPGVLFHDVTGDGVLDLLTCSERATVEGLADVGAVYLWAGGASLLGTPAPTARLVPETPQASTYLGRGERDAILIGDVVGSPAPDVVCLASDATVSGVFRAGAILVWDGAALAGEVSARAELRTGVLQSSLGLGNGGFELVDLTNEGRLDVLAIAWNASDGDVGQVGIAYLWTGGLPLALGGVRNPSYRFFDPDAAPGARMGLLRPAGFADVTGDLILDLVLGSSLADVQATDDGLIQVWRGGGPASEIVAPVASLSVPGANDSLALGREGIRLADVDGDGTTDILAAARGADVGGVDQTGAIYLWHGGSGLSGSPGPTAVLSVPGAAPLDRMPSDETYFRVLDYDQDGVDDVLGASWEADRAGQLDAGAIHLWRGGPGLSGSVAPSVTLASAPPGTLDALPRSAPFGEFGPSGILFGDVTGDGRPDLAAPAVESGLRGRMFLWDATTLVGTPAPSAVLETPSGVDLGYPVQGVGGRLDDVDADGVLDVLLPTAHANANNKSATGAVYLFGGGPGLVSAPSFATFVLPTPQNGAELCSTGGEGTVLGDVNGDGALDLVVGASLLDVGGVVDTGGVLVRFGPLAGSGARLLLQVPGAGADDRLPR